MQARPSEEPSRPSITPQVAPFAATAPKADALTARHDHDRRPSTGELLKEANDRFDDGKVGEAVALARRAAALGAGAPAHALLGHVYMSQGELERAEREFAQAVRMDPDDREAVDRLADVRRARLEQEQ